MPDGVRDGYVVAVTLIRFASCVYMLLSFSRSFLIILLYRFRGIGTRGIILSSTRSSCGLLGCTRNFVGNCRRSAIRKNANTIIGNGGGLASASSTKGTLVIGRTRLCLVANNRSGSDRSSGRSLISCTRVEWAFACKRERELS